VILEERPRIGSGARCCARCNGERAVRPRTEADLVIGAGHARQSAQPRSKIHVRSLRGKGGVDYISVSDCRLLNTFERSANARLKSQTPKDLCGDPTAVGAFQRQRRHHVYRAHNSQLRSRRRSEWRPSGAYAIARPTILFARPTFTTELWAALRSPSVSQRQVVLRLELDSASRARLCASEYCDRRIDLCRFLLTGNVPC
jgi:hypothetical protein